MATEKELEALLLGWPGGKPVKGGGKPQLDKILERAKKIKKGDCCDDVADMAIQLAALTQWCIDYRVYVEGAIGGGGGTPPPGPPSWP
jgi:hypothetical protein